MKKITDYYDTLAWMFMPGVYNSGALLDIISYCVLNKLSQNEVSCLLRNLKKTFKKPSGLKKECLQLLQNYHFTNQKFSSNDNQTIYIYNKFNELINEDKLINENLPFITICPLLISLYSLMEKSTTETVTENSSSSIIGKIESQLPLFLSIGEALILKYTYHSAENEILIHYTKRATTLMLLYYLTQSKNQDITSYDQFLNIHQELSRKINEKINHIYEKLGEERSRVIAQQFIQAYFYGMNKEQAKKFFNQHKTEIKVMCFSLYGLELYQNFNPPPTEYKKVVKKIPHTLESIIFTQQIIQSLSNGKLTGTNITEQYNQELKTKTNLIHFLLNVSNITLGLIIIFFISECYLAINNIFFNENLIFPDQNFIKILEFLIKNLSYSPTPYENLANDLSVFQQILLYLTLFLSLYTSYLLWNAYHALLEQQEFSDKFSKALLAYHQNEKENNNITDNLSAFKKWVYYKEKPNEEITFNLPEYTKTTGKNNTFILSKLPQIPPAKEPENQKKYYLTFGLFKLPSYKKKNFTTTKEPLTKNIEKTTNPAYLFKIGEIFFSSEKKNDAQKGTEQFPYHAYEVENNSVPNHLFYVAFGKKIHSAYEKTKNADTYEPFFDIVQNGIRFCTDGIGLKKLDNDAVELKQKKNGLRMFASFNDRYEMKINNINVTIVIFNKEPISHVDVSRLIYYKTSSDKKEAFEIREIQHDQKNCGRSIS